MRRHALATFGCTPSSKNAAVQRISTNIPQSRDLACANTLKAGYIRRKCSREDFQFTAMSSVLGKCSSTRSVSHASCGLLQHSRNAVNLCMLRYRADKLKIPGNNGSFEMENTSRSQSPLLRTQPSPRLYASRFRSTLAWRDCARVVRLAPGSFGVRTWLLYLT